MERGGGRGFLSSVTDNIVVADVVTKTIVRIPGGLMSGGSDVYGSGPWWNPDFYRFFAVNINICDHKR